MDIDYTNYTIEQLLDVKDHIDPLVAPDNHRRLLMELEKRADEIAVRQKQVTRLRHQSIITRTKVAAYYQLTCGGLFALIVGAGLWNTRSSGFYFQGTLLGIGVILLQISAGYWLLKENKIGIILTYINQLAQILGFSVGGIIYTFNAALSVGPVFTTESLTFVFKFNPSMAVSINDLIAPPYVSVNLLALMIILLLNKRQDLPPTTTPATS